MGSGMYGYKGYKTQIWSSKRSKPKCRWGSREKRIRFKVKKSRKFRKRSLRPCNLACNCLIFCWCILILTYYLFEIPWYFSTVLCLFYLHYCYLANFHILILFSASLNRDYVYLLPVAMPQGSKLTTDLMFHVCGRLLHDLRYSLLVE